MASCERFAQIDRLYRCLAVVTSALVICSLAWAQIGRGTLTGRVMDSSGAVVPSAAVTAIDPATQAKVMALTAVSGQYTLVALVPGTYDLDVVAQGFKEYVQRGITVTVGNTVTADVTMQVGVRTERVEVTGEAPQLQADNSDIAAAVTSGYMLELPLTVQGTMRDPLYFVSLVPGYSGEAVADGFAPYKLSGGQWGGTDILMDGATIQLTLPRVPSLGYGVSVDAVQEFNVQSGNFAAEYGRTSSGIVNLVLKSGTNSLHGSAYEFLRNKSLDANAFFSNRAGVDTRSKNQHDYGFVSSGPVYIPKIFDGRNKLFWMSSLERYTHPVTDFGLVTVPTEAFKRGDLSALLPDTVIYDPANCVHGACLPFPNNQIPQGRFSTVSKNFIPLVPRGNDALVNNAQQITHSQTSEYIFTEKGNVSWSDKQKISGSITRGPQNQSTASSLGPIYSSHTNTSITYVRLAHDYIFRPNLLNHFNYGLSRSPFTFHVDTVGLPQYQPSAIGLRNVADLTSPAIDWVGSGYIGSPSGFDRLVDQSAQFNDDVSRIRGRHAMKFGIDVRHQQLNSALRDTASGGFVFESRQTADQTAGGGHAWASFLLGLVSSSTLSTGTVDRVQWNYYSVYGQDNFKVSPTLTLNYGFRYEIPQPAKEAHDRFSGFDISLPNPGADGRVGAYTYFGTGPGRNGRSRPQDTFMKSYSPRFGFAYQVNPKTVIRGGYGIFYSAVKPTGPGGQDQIGFAAQSSPSNFNWDDGFPAYSAGLTPEGQNGQSHLAFIDRSGGRPGMIQNWTLDIQRQLARNLLWDIAYVASKGDHLPSMLRHPNQADPKYLGIYGSCLGALITEQATDPRCAGKPEVAMPFSSFVSLWGTDATVGRALRPYPQVGHFDTVDYAFTPDRSGSFTYHSLQTKLEKRFSAGLAFLVSYTWSKNLTDADTGGGGSGFFGTGNFLAQDNYNRKVEKTLSQLDTPHALVLSYMYELPLGKGKKLLNRGGAANVILGGWSVAGVQRYQSGIPVGAWACGVFTGLYGKDDWFPCLRPNLVLGQPIKGFSGHFDPSRDLYLNPAALTMPPNFSFGGAPIALPGVRSPARNSEDFTLSKRTRIREKVTFTLRGEFFNIFNRTIFSIPTFDVSFPPAFGIVSSTYFLPRHIQIAARIEFE